MDDLEYLTEGFNPASLTVARLRNLLNKHDIDYNSSAKKAELVQTFRDNITANAAILRGEAHAVLPHGVGIVNAEPPVRTRTTRSRSPEKVISRVSRSQSPAKPSDVLASPRKVSRGKATTPVLEAEESDETLKKASPRKKRVLSSKPAMQLSEGDTEPQHSGSRGGPIDFVFSPRKSPQKVAKAESDDDGDVVVTSMTVVGDTKTPEKEAKAGSSPFTQDNVFQASARKSSTPTKKRSLDESPGSPPSKKKRDSDMRPVRHFDVFPDEEVAAPTPLVTAPSSFTPERTAELMAPFTEPRAAANHGPPADFSYTSHRSSSKRLSFMPDVTDLRVSQNFTERIRSALAEDDGPFGRTSLGTMPDLSVPKRADKGIKQEEEKPIVQENKEEDDQREGQKEEDEQKVDAALKELAADIEVQEAKKELGKHRRFFTWALLSHILVWLLYLSAGTALGGYAYWYRQQQLEIGYCNVGFASTEDGDLVALAEPYGDLAVQVARAVSPSCLACPAHATCYPGFVALCDEDFVYHPHYLAFGDLVPIPPRCLPDTEKQRKILVLANVAMQILRQRNADAECQAGHSASMEAGALKDRLRTYMSDQISGDEYDDLWQHVIKDIEAQDEVIVRRIDQPFQGHAAPGQDPITVPLKKTFVQSTSTANIPFGCRVRLSVGAALERNRTAIAAAVIVPVVAWVLRLFLMRRRIYNARVGALTQAAIDNLKKQKRAAVSDTQGLTPHHLPVPHLRDELLPDGLAGGNEKLWYDVQRRVEMNSKVRMRHLEEHGEIMRMWEWVAN